MTQATARFVMARQHKMSDCAQLILLIGIDRRTILAAELNCFLHPLLFSSLFHREQHTVVYPARELMLPSIL